MFTKAVLVDTCAWMALDHPGASLPMIPSERALLLSKHIRVSMHSSIISNSRYIKKITEKTRSALTRAKILITSISPHREGSQTIYKAATSTQTGVALAATALYLNECLATYLLKEMTTDHTPDRAVGTCTEEWEG
jgi:hypothetical protein